MGFQIKPLVHETAFSCCNNAGVFLITLIITYVCLWCGQDSSHEPLLIWLVSEPKVLIQTSLQSVQHNGQTQRTSCLGND